MKSLNFVFQVGDLVFAGSRMSLGANAKYICLPETGAIAIEPTHMTYEKAPAVSFGATASLIFLKDKGNTERNEARKAKDYAQSDRFYLLNL